MQGLLVTQDLLPVDTERDIGSDTKPYDYFYCKYIRSVLPYTTGIFIDPYVDGANYIGSSIAHFAKIYSVSFRHKPYTYDPTGIFEEGATWYRKDLGQLSYYAVVDATGKVRRIPYGDDIADLYADTITEKTAGAGVTVDGVLCKDGTIKVIGTDATAISVGDATTEGGDIIVYEDTAGNISFRVDADVADVTVGNSTTRLGLLTVWGEAGVDVLDLRVSSSGVGTRLEVLEHNLSALPYKAPLIKMTGEDGGIFGMLGGGMFLVDVGGVDAVYVYFTDATGTNIGYLQYTPSLDKLEILGFTSVAFGGFPVSFYEISVSAYVDSTLKPKADNTYDLGYYHPLPLLQRFWRNLYLRGNAEIDGWAYIDSLRVDEELNLDQIDIPATSVSGLSAVIPITVAGVTKYLAVYDSYA